MQNNAKVGIVGQGYVGLALSAAICAAGQSVIGVDIDHTKVKLFKMGEFPLDFLESDNLVKARNSGLYTVTSNFDDLNICDVVIIAVPTPLNSKGLPETLLLERACEDIAKHLRKDALVVSESTSHPGTLRNLIIPKICELREDSGRDLDFAIAPERVNPSDISFSVANTPRVVAGNSMKAGTRAKDFYCNFVRNVMLVEEPEVAELSKLIENSFRLININFVNELSEYCNQKGIDIKAAIDAAATKPFGFLPFYPSAGVGGHCIPVDPVYLFQDASLAGVELDSLEVAIKGNEKRPTIIVENLRGKIGPIEGKKILIEGVAYKSNVGDLREAPALRIASQLQKLGAKLYWHDPLTPGFPFGEKSEDYEKMDLVVVVVVHSKTDVEKLLKSSKVIFDLTYSLPRKVNVKTL